MLPKIRGAMTPWNGFFSSIKYLLIINFTYKYSVNEPLIFLKIWNKTSYCSFLHLLCTSVHEMTTIWKQPWQLLPYHFACTCIKIVTRFINVHHRTTNGRNNEKILKFKLINFVLSYKYAINFQLFWLLRASTYV